MRHIRQIVRRYFWCLIAAWCLIGTFLFNGQFLRVEPATMSAAMVAPPSTRPADVVEIYRGYQSTHTPFAASWWSGPWIHTNPRVHQSYRPVSSMLLWCETDLALRCGFAANGWVGVFLWALASFMATLFCWRLTRDRWCVAGLALLLPLFHFFEVYAPPELLWWYPFHPELLFIALTLGGLSAFDIYLETGRRTPLILTFLCFLTALMVKESAVIIPLFYFSLYVWRRSGRKKELSPCHRVREEWTNLGAFTIVSLLFLIYRRHVLTNPYGPKIYDVPQVFHGAFYYLSTSWYADLNADYWWISVLYVLLVTEGILLARLRRQAAWQSAGQRWLLLGGAVLLPLLFLRLTSGDVFAAILLLGESRLRVSHELTVLCGILLFCAAAPRWRRDPLLLAFTLLFLSTAPAWCFIGWHYMVVPWFFRAIMYVCVTRLALRQLASYRSPKSPSQLSPATAGVSVSDKISQ